jgi:hypothetical protein
MFEWTWDSVAAECTNFIGPAGYGFVQVAFIVFTTLLIKLKLSPRCLRRPNTLAALSGGLITNRYRTPLPLSAGIEASSRWVASYRIGDNS